MIREYQIIMLKLLMQLLLWEKIIFAISASSEKQAHVCTVTLKIRI